MNRIQQRLFKCLSFVPFFLFVGVVVAQNQVVIVPHIKSHLYHIEQLYQVMLVNNSDENLQGQLSITLEDKLGEVVFEAISMPMLLEAGAVRQSRQLQWPPRGSAGNAIDQTSVSGLGRLPMGQFNLCYNFRTAQASTIAGFYCHEFETKIAGVPALTYPLDGGKIQEDNPVLQWRPPTMLAGEVLTYDLVLVALQAGQSVAEGLARNAPLLTQRIIGAQQLIYPFSAPALQDEVVYAWQITAYWNDYEIGKTDIWTFSKGKVAVTPQFKAISTTNQSYPLLQRKISGAYHIVENELCFSFQNRFALPMLDYRILAADALDSQAFTPLDIALVPGWNKIAIPTNSPGMNLEADRFYYLEVIDGMGRKQYMKFKVL
ncbi:MAG: hypothetical protein AAFO03_02325 [Bacteroidota bacterium]